MQRIGVIDIGSNSVRLIIVEVGEYTYKLVDELKESIRLGEDVDEGKAINPEKMAHAIQTLRMFKILCDAMEVQEIIAVATAAVRKACNRESFLAEVFDETGLKIRTLTGAEEAFYAYTGVTKTMDLSDGLIMDIGGGSTELIWVQNGRMAEIVSLPFGSINLTKNFHLEDDISEEERGALQTFLQEAFKSVPWLELGQFTQLVGVGGSFRNVGKIDRCLKRYPLHTAHNYRMKNTDLAFICRLVNAKDLAQRKKIEGLSKERADIFPAAIAAIQGLVEYAGITDITISGNGIREGLVYDYLCTHYHPIEDILEFSLQNLMNRFNLNKQHSEQVYHLTRSLYSQLHSVHMIGRNLEKVIRTAAMLHDCGIQIRYYSHHEHSFYMILNSAINGLSHRELLLSAYIAASHRKDQIDLDWARFATLVDKQDIEIAQKISVLLKIAESLDRSKSGLVKDVHCEIHSNEVVMRIISNENPELEIYNATLVSKQFKKVYGKKLRVT